MNKNGRISPKVNYHRGNRTWKRLHQESVFEQMCHYMPIIHLQTKPFLHTFKVNCAFGTVISIIYLNFQLATNAPMQQMHKQQMQCQREPPIQESPFAGFPLGYRIHTL